jgi:uncharacterized protein (TIGR04255 family)
VALGDPRTDRLKRSPLSLVVCQVRHERTEGAGNPDTALAVHQAIKDDMPILEEQTSQELTVAGGLSGLQASTMPTSRGWKMRADDQAWTSVLNSDSFSLETTKYQDWSDFAPRFASLTQSVAEHVAPVLEARVGLRFIDRISHPDVHQAPDWRGWLNPALLGPIEDPDLGAAVIGTQNVLQLEFEHDQKVGLRFGSAVEEGSTGGAIFLLDTDCYVQRAVRFDVDGLLGVVESLHVLALQIFQWAIDERLYSYLKGES